MSVISVLAPCPVCRFSVGACCKCHLMMRGPGSAPKHLAVPLFQLLLSSKFLTALVRFSLKILPCFKSTIISETVKCCFSKTSHWSSSQTPGQHGEDRWSFLLSRIALTNSSKNLARLFAACVLHMKHMQCRQVQIDTICEYLHAYAALLLGALHVHGHTYNLFRITRYMRKLIKITVRNLANSSKIARR